MTISKVEDQENMLKGTFTTGGYTYNIGLSFNRRRVPSTCLLS